MSSELGRSGKVPEVKDYRALPSHRYPEATILRLKEEKFIGKTTTNKEMVMDCITCPLAEEPFYAQRAVECTGILSSTVIPIVNRLYKNTALENRRAEPLDPYQEDSPTRIVYDVSPKFATIATDGKVLNTCNNIQNIE